MKEFTGFDYLLIDAANNFGLDKLTFEERIQWATENLASLEVAGEAKANWKEKPLYVKAVQAIRKAEKGIPTGHLVGFDAVCSGLQLMAVMSGCKTGAEVTGLIDPDKRADAYTECTKLMNKLLGRHLPNERARIKNALMTALYGSKKEPESEFGEDTPELNAFYQAMYQLSEGACELLQVFKDSWQAYALSHSWELPDGYMAKIKVMQQHDCRPQVDELMGSKFTYTYSVNEGKQYGVKNIANIVHSVDAYVLRSLVRRCSYDAELVDWAATKVQETLLWRGLGNEVNPEIDDQLTYYIDLFNRTGIADIVILGHLYDDTVNCLSTEHLAGLLKVINELQGHKPFEIVTVHDDFKCHANNMNHLRRHYRAILCQLADSEIVSDILSQIHGVQGVYTKKSTDLSKYISQSNYSLC